MSKLRVLIVDDSVVIRRILTDIISSDADLEVAGVAATGRIALERIPQVTPDIVTLDVEMPEMNGLEALREIRKSHPCLPVIMFSTLTEHGAAATIEALALGASDYITKPANIGRVGEGIARVRDDLIPKIKALSGRIAVPLARPTRGQPALPVKRRRRVEASCIGVVAIGSSTGGPNALAELLPSLPRTLPAPVLIVQHMPPLFTKLLADRLAARSFLEVVEAKAGDELRPGKAWIAPGNYHMTVHRVNHGVRIELNQGPPQNSCRPAVDVLFRSVAEVYGAASLGVILTGMGQDGLRGCERISEAGGQVLAQDEATSVVWGMPGFVARAGLADKQLPIRQMATEIVHRMWNGRARGIAPGEAGGDDFRR